MRPSLSQVYLLSPLGARRAVIRHAVLASRTVRNAEVPSRALGLLARRDRLGDQRPVLLTWDQRRGTAMRAPRVHKGYENLVFCNGNGGKGMKDGVT